MPRYVEKADDFTILKACHPRSFARPRPRPYSLAGHRLLRPSSILCLERPTNATKLCQKPLSPATYGSSSTQSSPSSYGFSSPSPQSSPSTTCSQSSYSFRVSSPAPADHSRTSISLLASNSQSRSYHLEVVQHPVGTAEFGTSGLLSRLPITPPIVVRLTVRDTAGNIITPDSELPFLIAHLSLFSGDGTCMVDMGSNPSGGPSPPARLLYGNLVSMAYRLRDLQGNPGMFFLFPDVSIRWRGSFQIAVSLLRLSLTEPGASSAGRRGQLLAQARTRPFNVYPPGEYTPMPTTQLTQQFIRQGARMVNYTPSPHA